MSTTFSLFVQLPTLGAILFCILVSVRPATAGTWLSFTQGGNQAKVGEIEDKIVPSLPTNGELVELMKDCNNLYRETMRKRLSSSALLKRDGTTNNVRLLLCQRLLQLLNRE